MVGSLRNKDVVLVAIAMLTVYPDVSLAAWRLFTKEYEKTQVRYSIREDRYAPQEGFYFPDYTVNDSVLYVGYRPTLRQDSESWPYNPRSGLSDEQVWVWRKKFRQPLQCTVESTVLYQRIFAENMSGYSIYLLSDKDNVWYKREFKTPEEGYQIPTTETLSKWITTNSDAYKQTRTFVSEENPQNAIREFLVILEPRSEDFEFFVGDWEFYDRRLVEREYHHPLFEGIIGESLHQRIVEDSFSRQPGDPRLLLDFGAYSLAGRREDIFYLDSDDRRDDGRQLANQLFRRVFDRYPYYNEHGIDREAVLSRFGQISQSQMSFEAFIDSTRTLIEGFHDVHFYFAHDNDGAVTKPAPVYAYEIDNRILVAAVFDSSLQKTIRPGDRILAIDGQHPDTIVDKISFRYGGNEKLRRFKAVFQLLRRSIEDSVQLSVLSSATGDTVRAMLKYDRRLIVPAKFRPKNGEFKMIERDIAYFYMRTFSPDIWVRFANHYNNIRYARGLILDLRGNKGGDEITVLRLLSTFISRPAIVAHAYSPSRPDDLETIVVGRHPKFHLDLPVVILSDQRTACASEIFIHGMRRNAGAVLVSNSKTAGAVSMALPVVFRRQFAIVLNTWTDVLLPPDSVRLEGRGLTPDIWVWIRKIEDLRPYEDKILKTAVRYLGGWTPLGAD